MPRKTRSISARPASAAAGFNEAAARCRGKRQDRWRVFERQKASMRPRPDAAENVAGRQRRPVGHHASMRPRPDAAENNGSGHRLRPPDVRASMRPRPDAAENPAARDGLVAWGLASMRPRPDAAENDNEAITKVGTNGGFNEAAARCRGKPAAAS